MKPMRRYAIITLVVLFLYGALNMLQTFVLDKNYFSSSVLSSSSGEMVDGNLKSLQFTVDDLRKQIFEKERDINKMQEAFALNVKYYETMVGNQRAILQRMSNNNNININNSPNNITNNETDTNINVLADQERRRRISMSRYDVELPHSYDMMPHMGNLSAGLDAIQPKFKLSKGRHASIVMGVPTIKREHTSYLVDTIKSLFDAMNDFEKTDALVVVMIAEVEDMGFVQSTIESLDKAFKYEISIGLLEVIVPPAEYYPNLDDLGADLVFNDSADRTKWRTKQNYDFSYLMLYAQRRGTYYLQLEDDVVAKMGFYSLIKTFVQKQATRAWMMIEFTQLGFIGKLFHARDLKIFVSFFLMFARDKPCDWLFDNVFSVKICNPERTQADCTRAVNTLKIRYKPSLFQHVGVLSSLRGKKQQLKDKDFGKQQLIVHNNPPGKLTTSLQTYMKFTLESVYLGQNFFWALAPKANDYVLFEFNEPVKIYKYFVRSGSPEHPDDRFCNSTLSIQTITPIVKSLMPASYVVHKDNYYTIDRVFDQSGTFSGYIDPNVTGKISRIRIEIGSASESWLVISDVDFSTKPIDSQQITQTATLSMASLFAKS